MTQTVLITGASTGFGKATALRFAASGWHVVATMRDPAAGADLAGAANILVTRLDVQDLSSIDEAIDAGIARFGAIDAVVDNAGFGLFGIFEGATREKVGARPARGSFSPRAPRARWPQTRAPAPHARRGAVARRARSYGSGTYVREGGPVKTRHRLPRACIIPGSNTRWEKRKDPLPKAQRP